MDIRHWLKQAVATLCGGDSPKRDAEILLGFVTGKSRSWLIAFDETALSDAQLAQLDSLLARRARGEPVAHLVGEREFWSLPLRVSDATLIPRPDTELLVEQALANHHVVHPFGNADSIEAPQAILRVREHFQTHFGQAGHQ